MKTSYIKALEQQAKWFNWGSNHSPSKRTTEADPNFENAFLSYTAVLQSAETIFMNRKFCDLVDFARLTVPDELAFEEEWMFTPMGFLYLEDPFSVPDPKLELERWGKESDYLKAMAHKMVLRAVDLCGMASAPSRRLSESVMRCRDRWQFFKKFPKY